MTREEVLAAIELSESATGGPWQVQSDGWAIRVAHPSNDERGAKIAHTCSLVTTGVTGNVEQQVDDANFIAESRTLVPALAKALMEAMDRAEKAERDVLRLRAHHVESLVFEMVQEPESESLPVISDGWSCGICGGGFDAKEAVEHPDDTCPLYVAKDPE